MKKIVFILLAIALVAGLIYMFWPKTNSVKVGNETVKTEIEVITGLKTCEVCGYDALEKIGATCKNCGVALTQENIDSEGLDHKSFIVMKQMEYFMPDTLGKSIDFLKPLITEKGYPKNTNWRPSVYESEIYEFQKMMIEIEAGTDSTLAN